MEPMETESTTLAAGSGPEQPAPPTISTSPADGGLKRAAKDSPSDEDETAAKKPVRFLSLARALSGR